MKRIIAMFCGLILSLALSFALSAQSRSVTVLLQDSSSGEPLGYATVSLTKAGASSAFKYALTSDQGKAVLEKVAAGTYVFKAELLGYKTFTKEITVKDDLNLGTIKVDPDKQVLNAASVSATGNPIVIKKDTVEYNASSFKTTDNDVLEDLLKKLPGVEVSEDGSVTANGQTISKITIDGKTFFLDDPQLASKNIPAKIVDKVKVVQKKSDQAQFTGIGDGQYDAFVKALRRIYRDKLGRTLPDLLNYAVTIPPGGRTDALVQTVITWRDGEKIFRTRALDADQTQAAINATFKMLNIIEM